jgi:RNA polymerase sigma factor (sigma-70 family)
MGARQIGTEKRSMNRLTAEREIWLARHILPCEAGLRSFLSRWNLPADLEADDIVQECYSRLAGMETVASIQNPRAYFYAIARTIILSHIRHSKVVSIRSVDNLEDYDMPLDEPSPEEQASDRQQLHMLALAVAALPEWGRSAFLMRVVEGLSHKEIGAKLGVTDEAVQKSVAKSLKKFTDLLGRGGKNRARASNQPRKSTENLEHDQARDERGD